MFEVAHQTIYKNQLDKRQTGSGVALKVVIYHLKARDAQVFCEDFGDFATENFTCLEVAKA
jgi:hypothetical protein